MLMLNKIKKYILKIYSKKVIFRGDVKIFGRMPYFKVRHNSKCIIGNNVTFNSDERRLDTALTNICNLSIGFNAILTIGDNTVLNGVSITAFQRVEIGKMCQIASNTFIADTDFHPIDPEERKKQTCRLEYDKNKVNKKEIIICDNVWIGWGAIILKGAKIGNNSIVAAGSIVTGEFPDNVIIAGNPAKIVKFM